MFSVGVLYSCQTFLQIVREDRLDVANFERNFRRIEVAEGKAVLSTAQQCQWIRILEDGRIRLTERGEFILNKEAAELCLREQLLDIFAAAPPPWARKMIQGRYEVLKVMPPDAAQCFKDCDLTEGFDDETVDWWDQASQTVRSERSRLNHVIGRKAEKLTLRYEHERTGVEPLWQAVQTNVAGYDVLSCKDAKSQERLKIEVKGSRMGRKEASFFLTRNEWRTAEKSDAYELHLWLVHETPALFVVPAQELKPHVPEDREHGKWETAHFFFKHFRDYAVALS
ncbi:MAG: DUF3883 domain-containing protein [Pseudomonadota bacterium]